jgi:hypothetical protein
MLFGEKLSSGCQNCALARHHAIIIQQTLALSAQGFLRCKPAATCIICCLSHKASKQAEAAYIVLLLLDVLLQIVERNDGCTQLVPPAKRGGLVKTSRCGCANAYRAALFALGTVRMLDFLKLQTNTSSARTSANFNKARTQDWTTPFPAL